MGFFKWVFKAKKQKPVYHWLLPSRAEAHTYWGAQDYNFPVKISG